MNPQSQYKVPIYAHFPDRSPEEDCIVYVKKTKAGGVDGKDHTDKGGLIVKASYKPLPSDHYYTLEKRVIEVNKAKKEALAKLNPIDRLVLGV